MIMDVCNIEQCFMYLYVMYKHTKCSEYLYVDLLFACQLFVLGCIGEYG